MDICYRTRKCRTSEAISIGSFDEPKKSCTGTRWTETCVVPINSHDVDASRDTRADHIFSLLYAPCFFLRTISVGGVGARCQIFWGGLFFCSVDHKRDWPPYYAGAGSPERSQSPENPYKETLIFKQLKRAPWISFKPLPLSTTEGG